MSKAGDALKLLYKDLGVSEKLRVDGSKEQACKETTFMKEVHRQSINYNISDHELHQHNPVEGVIR